MDTAATASSGSSPPTELVDADSEGVWEQMSPRVYRNLDEIFAGEYDGFTEAQIGNLSTLSVRVGWLLRSTAYPLQLSLHPRPKGRSAG